MSEQVSNPLTLVMEIKSAKDYEELRGKLEHIQSMSPDKNPISIALTKISTVHFARFVFIDATRLAVITAYDGSFSEYIDAFAREIGSIFDQLLVHTKGAPPLPVSEHPVEFMEFVKKHDLKCLGPFYSAYPNLKVLDILTLERERQN